VKKQDGATLYLTRDIAAAYSRAGQYHFDKALYVVATQQNLHFQQLFRVLSLMGAPWAGQCQHINFGLVRGMKTRYALLLTLLALQPLLLHFTPHQYHPNTPCLNWFVVCRTGEVVFLEEILDEAREVMKARTAANPTHISSATLDQIAEQLGVSAVIIQDLLAKRGKDYEVENSPNHSTHPTK